MNWLKRRSEGFWWVLAAILVFVVGVTSLYVGWDWLRCGTEESRGTTIRNAFLIIGGLDALLLAIWRSRVSERQTQVANEQARTALRQSDTAHRSLLNERFQKGAEMLGSSVVAVRLGGIYALQGLAEQHPEQYHVPVMQQLCSFVRYPTEVEGQPTVGPSEVGGLGGLEIEVVREDIQSAIHSIASCHTRNLQFETQHNYWIDLHGAELRGVNLSNKDLSRAPECDKAAPFDYAMIGTMHTNLRGVKLHNAYLARTNLTQVDLSHASGLTQSILDDACADPRMPPKLENAFDAETGKALEWKANPCKEDGIPASPP